jgi:hypothetical protein
MMFLLEIIRSLILAVVILEIIDGAMRGWRYRSARGSPVAAPGGPVSCTWCLEETLVYPMRTFEKPQRISNI